MIEDIIYEKIAVGIKCTHLDVSGDGRHFDAVVVSDEFVSKPLLERHRMIYTALGELMKEEVHALSMKLYTKLEWEKVNG